MMLPRRVPFIGAVPLPMISSCPRSVTSPTSTQTLEVPMSSATMYFSSVFGMSFSSFFLICDQRRDDPWNCNRRRQRRIHRLENQAIAESQVGVLDVAASVVLRGGDGIQIAPLRRQIILVCVNRGAQFAVKQGKTMRQQRAHFGQPAVDSSIAHAQPANQSDGA